MTISRITSLTQADLGRRNSNGTPASLSSGISTADNSTRAAQRWLFLPLAWDKLTIFLTLSPSLTFALLISGLVAILRKAFISSQRSPSGLASQKVVFLPSALPR